MPPFHADSADHGDRSVLGLAGELDLANAQNLSTAAIAALDRPQIKELEIDLGGVTFMDSTALGALVTVRNAAIELGKRLSLTNIPERVQRLLSITALDMVFGLPTASDRAAVNSPADGDAG